MDIDLDDDVDNVGSDVESQIGEEERFFDLEIDLDNHPDFLSDVANQPCENESEQHEVPSDSDVVEPKKERLFLSGHHMDYLCAGDDGYQNREYDIEDIVGRRRDGRGGFEIKIRWVGYSKDFDTWEPQQKFRFKKFSKDEECIALPEAVTAPAPLKAEKAKERATHF